MKLEEDYNEEIVILDGEGFEAERSGEENNGEEKSFSDQTGDSGEPAESASSDENETPLKVNVVRAQKNSPKINWKAVLIAVAVVAVAVFLIVRIYKGSAVDPQTIVGQWTDHEHDDASLDIWDTDGETFVGMSSWQVEYNSAVFLDFEAVADRQGLKVVSCKRTDMVFDEIGDGEETIVYENATGTIRLDQDGHARLTIDGDPDTETFVFGLEGAY